MLPQRKTPQGLFDRTGNASDDDEQAEGGGAGVTLPFARRLAKRTLPYPVFVPAQQLASLSRNRRIKALVEIAAFAAAVANDEARPGSTSTHRSKRSNPPSPHKQPSAAPAVPLALEVLVEAGTEETSEAVDSGQNVATGDADAGADAGSFFLTDSSDLSPSRVHSSGANAVADGPVSPRRPADLQSPVRPTEAEIVAAGEEKRERIANHVKWINVLAKHGLPWFNAVPDRDILICNEAIRNTKSAIQARYNGWQSVLDCPLPVKITIKDIRIADMAAMDLGGTSDPFCILQFGGVTNTTSIIMETLSPVWKDLDFDYFSYDCSTVMSISVWDWDDGADNDLIGRCYVHVEDIIRNRDKEISRELFNEKGSLQGLITLRLVCDSMPKEPLPSDNPDTCARLAASLTLILWHLGVPRSKSALVLKTILKAEAPDHVIQRLGEVGVAMSLYVCQQHWLVNIIGRWKLFSDFQIDRREKIRSENAPKLAIKAQNSWDDKLLALQKQAAKDIKGPKINVSKHINMEGVPKGNRDENLALAQAFCDRAVLNVSDPDKAESVMEEFQDLYSELAAVGAGHETLALDLMAEVLAKYEREARLVDQVDEEVERIQKAVKADQGPDGVGLLPRREPRKSEAFKWMKHRKDMEKKKAHMPLDYYLEPFMKAHCKDITHMRQAVIDMGDYFMEHVDAVARRDVGPALLAIAGILKEKVAEIELAYEKKLKALGKVGAGALSEKQEARITKRGFLPKQHENNVASCRKWHMLNDDKLLSEVDEEMQELLAYWKANLVWSMSAAVMMERETVEARLAALRQSEMDRFQAEQEAAELAAKIAREKAEAIDIASAALAEAEEAGNDEEMARLRKELRSLEGLPEEEAQTEVAQQEDQEAEVEGATESQKPGAEPSDVPAEPSKASPEKGSSRAKGKQSSKPASKEAKGSTAVGTCKPSVSKRRELAPSSTGSDESESSDDDEDEEDDDDDDSDNEAVSGARKPAQASCSDESSTEDEEKPRVAKAAAGAGKQKGPAKKPSAPVAKIPQAPIKTASVGKVLKGAAASPRSNDGPPKAAPTGTKRPVLQAEKGKPAQDRGAQAIPPRQMTQAGADARVHEAARISEVTSSGRFLAEMPSSDAAQLEARVTDAFTAQMKFALSEDPQQLSSLGLALQETGADEGGDGHVRQGETGDDRVQVFDAEMRLLESVKDDPSHFNILELKGEAKSFQRPLAQKRLSMAGHLDASPTEACAPHDAPALLRTLESVEERTSDHTASKGSAFGEGARAPAPPPVLSNLAHGGPLAADDLPRQVYEAIMQVKGPASQAFRGPIEAWRKSLMTVVTWRERVFLVWKPKAQFLAKVEEQKAMLSKPRPEALFKQQMAQMTTNIFLQYVDGIKKAHQKPDDAKQRATDKHKKRLAMSHAHLMRPSRSTLPFDFLSYCVSEDTMVFLKELNRDAKFVASFAWKRVFALSESDSKRREMAPGGETGEDDLGELLSICVDGGQGVTHRLFTIWSSAWQIFVSIRHYIRRYAIQVPFYYRLGDTDTHKDSVLVRSVVSIFDAKRAQQSISVAATGISSLAQRLEIEDSFHQEEDCLRQLSQADINDILSYQGAESPLPTADSGRMPESALSGARAFLKTAGRDLMDLVEGEIALLQGCLRRRLVLRDIQIQFEKNMRQMVMYIADAACETVELSNAVFESMVTKDLLENGYLPDGSNAAQLVLTKVPLNQWAPRIGIDWDTIIDEAQTLREAQLAKHVLADESRRIQDIVNESKRQLQLRCSLGRESNFVVKGLTSRRDQPRRPHSADERDAPWKRTGGKVVPGYVFTNLGSWGQFDADTRRGYEPDECPDDIPHPSVGTVHGVRSMVHLSDKPAVANQVRIMRSRPRFVIRRRRPARQGSPPVMPSDRDAQGERPGTFRAWGQGHPYSRGRTVSPPPRPPQSQAIGSTQSRENWRARVMSPGPLSPLVGFVNTPPRTGAPPRTSAPSRTGGTAFNLLSSRKGTAYSRVDFIDESDEEVDFLAEPSFSYTAPKTEALKTELDDPELNPFTSALKEAARRAIMNRIAELQAKISPQKKLTGRQVKQTTTALKYVSAELRANKEFILEQVRKDPKALQHADAALKNDFQVVMAAVEQNGLCLELASKEMRNNDKIVIAAVRQRGRALKFASDPMKDNVDVVTAAVEKEGDSLFFASDRLKRDRDIALAALKSDGNALQHLPAGLRKDPNIVLTAAKNSSTSLAHADINWNEVHAAKTPHESDKARNDLLIQAAREMPSSL